MWPRFYKEDYLTIAHYLGVLLALISVIMIAPLGVALAVREWDVALNFFVGIGLGLFISSALRLAKVRPRGINRRQALMVTALVWVVASMVAAVPMYLSGHFGSYLDASFDVVSGFTDTGVSIISDLNHLSYANNLWRHTLQLIGGQGIVVIMLGFGVFAKHSGASLLYQAEGRNDMMMHQLRHTTRFIVLVSSIFVGVGILGSVITMIPTGMSLFKALFHSTCLVFAAFATGGFSPMSSSMVYYHNFPLEVVQELIMLSGMFSFALYFAMLKRGASEFLRDIEVKTIAIWIGICVVIVALSMARDSQFNQLDTLIRRGVFVVISAASNTGFSTMYVTQMAEVLSKGAFFAILLSMGMGGATNSTTGGIKAFRVAAVFKTVAHNVKTSLVSDRAVMKPRFYHLGQQVLDSQQAKEVMTISLLYVVTYMFGGMVGVVLGYAPMDAIFESVSIASNAGLSSGITSSDMPLVLKILYLFEMLFGRLEFLTMFASMAAVVVSFKQYLRQKKEKRADGR